MTSTAILIPARWGSTRYEGKPLVDLDGKPMIKRVFDECTKSGLDTFVLTDDMRIFELFGSGQCWIDETPYNNGTERCAGAIDNGFFHKYNRFINVQGDMPDVTVDVIDTILKGLNTYDVTTVCAKNPSRDPNCVKVDRDVKTNTAKSFTRTLLLDEHHLGVYGYSREALQFYGTTPCAMEIEHGLEQLRWMHMGTTIGCHPVDWDGIEINTPKDANKWRRKRI